MRRSPNGFLRRYLTRLSEEFIRLFLKGSTRHMHAIFGFVNEGKAPKHLALPAAQMLRAMQRDESLTGAQRSLLMQRVLRRVCPPDERGNAVSGRDACKSTT